MLIAAVPTHNQVFDFSYSSLLHIINMSPACKQFQHCSHINLFVNTRYLLL